MDKRKAEIDALSMIVDFLCTNYPDSFGKEEYTHPVKGVCKSLIINRFKVHVDYNNINAITIEYDCHSIKIFTDNTSYEVLDFFKDETVM